MDSTSAQPTRRFAREHPSRPPMLRVLLLAGAIVLLAQNVRELRSTR